MNNLVTVTINTTPIQNSLDSVRSFGIFLNKSLTVLRMSHWFTEDYNTHKIIGELYDSLGELFDDLEEEIIGTSKQQGKLFPHISCDVDIDSVNSFDPKNGSNMESFYKVCQTICSTLTSSEFSAYTESVVSGINNTKEEILSSINKANYLLSLVKL